MSFGWEDSMKNCIDMPIFHTLFVSERKQIAMMADANLRFASPLRDESLRKEEFMIFFAWNDFFGIKRLPGYMAYEDEIPKFMCKEPEFRPEALTTGDRMFIASHTFYYNDGRVYKNYTMPKFWVTDRINNLFMMSIDEDEYWLIVNNQPVRVNADFDYEGNMEDGYHVSWDIRRVITPSVLYYISDAQMQKIVKKAFEAYAYIILEKNEK